MPNRDEMAEPSLLEMTARRDAVKQKMLECLEELDLLGHSQAGAYLQMAIDTLPAA
jgi:hypothetical protein